MALDVWAEKYRPKTLKQLVGQQTNASPMNKLLKWMTEWSKNNLEQNEVPKKVKQTPYQAQQDGSSFKAALLSGPPGVGKTTSAVLCCKQLGLFYVEMNASDARNKLQMERHCGQLSNNQIEQYFSKDKILSESGKIRHVLIMDEVDGMSGNADRSGISELIQMIKKTKVPIICICNDRQSSKIRSLANHCFDLRFQLPRNEQIKSILLTIVTREKVKVSGDFLNKIIEKSHNDIRQCINSLQLMANNDALQLPKKDVSVNIFDAARNILSVDTNLFQKQELFFSDYSLMPLFVYENYINVRNVKIGNAQHVNSMKRASNCIAFGDNIEKCIRSDGQWNLLVDQSMLSCAIPSQIMDGHAGQVQFPSFFGRYSNSQKRQRLARQLSLHTHLRISGSLNSFISEYLPLLYEKVYRFLIQNVSEGIRDAVNLCNYYNLLREDLEIINELALWPCSNSISKNLPSLVSTKTKMAFTRALNKERRIMPYQHSISVTKGKRAKMTSPDDDPGDLADPETMESDDVILLSDL